MASFCFIFAAQRNQFVLLHLPEFPWTSQIPIDFPSFFTFHPHFPKEPGATTALQAAVAPNLLARVLMVAMGLTAMLYAELKLATWRGFTVEIPSGYVKIAIENDHL